MKPKPVVTRIVWAITVVLMLIGVAIVALRTASLIAPRPAPRNFTAAADLDKGFTAHRLLTLLHIFPGLTFILLAPLQFVETLRNRRPKVHRVLGRIALGAGLITGGTALVMSPQMAIGGLNETAATTFFAIVFLFDLLKGYQSIRRGMVTVHREWMIRAFAIGFAVAAIRPIVGIFFATSRLTHLGPHEFFGTAFWIGFTLHLIAAEVWINYTRPSWRLKNQTQTRLAMQI